MGISVTGFTAGFTQRKREIDEDNFRKEFARREAFAKYLSKIAEDPDVWPSIRTKAGAEIANLLNNDKYEPGKPYKFNPRILDPDEMRIESPKKGSVEAANQPKFDFKTFSQQAISKALEANDAERRGEGKAEDLFGTLMGGGHQRDIGFERRPTNENLDPGFTRPSSFEQDKGFTPPGAPSPIIPPRQDRSLPEQSPLIPAAQPMPQPGGMPTIQTQPRPTAGAAPASPAPTMPSYNLGAGSGSGMFMSPAERARQQRASNDILNSVEIPDDPILKEYGITPGTYSPGQLKAKEWAVGLREREEAKRMDLEARRQTSLDKHAEFIARLDQQMEIHKDNVELRKQLASQRNELMVDMMGIRNGLQRDLITMREELQGLPTPVADKVATRASAITAVDTMRELVKDPEVRQIIGAVRGSDWWSRLRQQWQTLTPKQQEFATLLNSFKADQIHEKYGSALTRTEVGFILGWASSSAMDPKNLQQRLDTTAQTLRAGARAQAYSLGVPNQTDKVKRAYEAYGIPWQEIDMQALEPQPGQPATIAPPSPMPAAANRGPVSAGSTARPTSAAPAPAPTSAVPPPPPGARITGSKP